MAKNEQFEKFAYPIWFMRLLGLAEIFASMRLFFTIIRFYGIGIFWVILLGAIFTHIKVKDSKKQIMAPFIVALHLRVIFLMVFLFKN